MKYFSVMCCIALLGCGCVTVAIRKRHLCSDCVARLERGYVTEQVGSDREAYLSECQIVAQEDWSADDLVGTSLTTREYTKNYRVVYADTKVLSYYLEEMEYTGGAHGMTTVTTGVINRATGKTMTLADILPTSKHAALLQALQTALIARLGSADALLDEVFIPSNFYVAKDGLHFVYNVYEVACYAAGTLDIVIDPATL